MARDSFPRVSGREREILELLGKSVQPLYGLQIVAQTGVTRGSVYVLLDRMKEKGLVESESELEPGHPGLPRHLYQVSGLGQRVLLALEARDHAWVGEPIPSVT